MWLIQCPPGHSVSYDREEDDVLFFISFCSSAKKGVFSLKEER